MKPHHSHDFSSRRCALCGEDVLSIEARYRCRPPVPDEPSKTDQPDELEPEELDAIVALFGDS